MRKVNVEKSPALPIDKFPSLVIPRKARTLNPSLSNLRFIIFFQAISFGMSKTIENFKLVVFGVGEEVVRRLQEVI